MGGIQLALLLFLLGWERGLSLQCYNCTKNMDRAKGCQPAQCATSDSICVRVKLTMAFSNGTRNHEQYKGCVPSCAEIKQEMSLISGHIIPETENEPVAMMYIVKEVTCCEEDLCNGGPRPRRSPWALAAGLLLSLGPACLWALL
ncbi:lymphocyte antigen 6H-like [Suricata suricatta]|uniref:lymphocyte antigen 6H-like n=1 Tax=Suricata suricatta TaxID=37032 RepID=UPI00115558A9|nr:lymphocyte antigen 6H-like [Suricata suricatta]